MTHIYIIYHCQGSENIKHNIIHYNAKEEHKINKYIPDIRFTLKTPEKGLEIKVVNINLYQCFIP